MLYFVLKRIYPKKYAHNSRIVVVMYGSILTFSVTATHMIVPVPVEAFRMLENIHALHEFTITDIITTTKQSITKPCAYTVYPKKYAHGFVVLCFVVVMQSFIMNSHEVFIHIHQGCFAGTGAIVRLPQCQWSKPDGYGKISQCITTTKHSKAKTVCIFRGIYCI